jgi:ribosomal protein L44E
LTNRRLTEPELESFRPLLEEVRKKLRELSGGDEQLFWAFRRKLAKELSYDERGKPMLRRQLKAFKRGEQSGKCAVCNNDLPERNTVLDRFEAMNGYTAENTRLICKSCDDKIQAERGFA